MSNSAGPNSYAAAGVDTEAGDRAVELMKAAVARTHGPEVLGGVGGFAGLFDASALLGYRKPLLASGTDGVGTKVAIAQALDKHDTVGQDLVAMIVDDIVVVGAKPLFLTDYIACGRLVPERIAEIVGGVARACEATGTALVGGETAEHPGLLGPDEYDLAGAAVGVVEADRLLGPDRVRDGDIVLAMASSGIHSNGFSLVRKILADAGIGYGDAVSGIEGPIGLALLEPTRLYTSPLLAALADETAGPAIHAFSHVTGGGIAANLARVLPQGARVDLDRSTWTPSDVFQVLSDLSGSRVDDHEETWNLGIGMFAVVDSSVAGAVAATLAGHGIETWQAGVVETGDVDLNGYVQGAKGVNGGAVRLVGSYA